MQYTYSLFLTLIITIFLFACGPSTEDAMTGPASSSEHMAAHSTASTAELRAAAAPTQPRHSFDPRDLPKLSNQIGEFPYVTAPNGYHLVFPVQLRDYDYYYFPIYGEYQKFTGKMAKVNVNADSGQVYSSQGFIHAFDQQMQQIGAQKLNHILVPAAKYHLLDDHSGEHALMGHEEVIYSYGFINAQGNAVIIQYGRNGQRGFTVMEIQSLAYTLKQPETEIADAANATAENILGD